MRRPATEGAEGSMEMLLDTITNAFGGILFLGLLIALLLRLSGRENPQAIPDALLQSEVISLENQLENRLQVLSSSLRSQDEQRQLWEQLGRNQLLDSHRELMSLRSQFQNLQVEVAEQVRVRADIQKSVNSVLQQIENLDTQIRETERELIIKQAELALELQKHTQQSRLPKTHLSSKNEIEIILRYGKVFVPYQYDPRTAQRRFNDRDFLIIESESDSLRITPKPYAGKLVATDASFVGDLSRILAGRGSGQWDIVICVWEDSFKQFLSVKNAMVELGFEYRLIPLSNGELIVSGYVPERQVQ